MKSSVELLVSLALAGLLAGSAFASEPEVAMTKPAMNRPAFGPTEVAIEVYPLDTPVESVEFFLDGLFVGRVEAPPFVLQVDAGQDNAEHLFEAVVNLPGRDPLSDRMTTPALRTEEVIDVQLQQLFVTVERDGAEVQELTVDDFIVIDQGQRQKMITFERGDIPFTAVLLIDSSDSMQSPKLETALAGAKAFVAGLERYDEVKLVQFSDEILFETPFTSFASVIALSFGQVEASGGTSVNDSLYFAHKRLAGRQGRQVIVLLSDGVDIHSVLEIDQLLQVARAQQTVIHWVRLADRGETSGPIKRYTNWRSAEEHATELEGLEAAVVESGGSVRLIADIGQVESAFADLLEELRSQYVLGYYPHKVLGAGHWHELDVSVRDPRLKLRVRSGYTER